MNDEIAKFLRETESWEVVIPARRSNGPRITMYGRLRGVTTPDQYGRYFTVQDSRDADGGIILIVTFHPEINSDPRKMYHKASTEKGGGFIDIKDVCGRLFGPEPKNGWHFSLKEISRSGNVTYYKIVER